MIIFNISCHMAHNTLPKFEEWVAESLLPHLSSNSLIESYKQLKMLSEIEANMSTHIFQLHFSSNLYYNQFEIEHQAMLLDFFSKQFGQEVYCFTTLLQEL